MLVFDPIAKEDSNEASTHKSPGPYGSENQVNKDTEDKRILY